MGGGRMLKPGGGPGGNLWGGGIMPGLGGGIPAP